VQNLTLQVRGVHDVVVDDPYRAHTGGSEIEGRRRPEPTGSHHQRTRLEEPQLARLTDFRKSDVAGIS
jgi:hypothetical protein